MKSLRLFSVIVLAAFAAIPQPAAAQAPAPASADPAFQEQLNLANKNLQEQKYKEALDALKRASKLKHDVCGECDFLMAIAYFRLKDLGHATESCNRALATAETDGLRAMAHNLKGNLALAGGGDAKSFSLAEHEFQAAVQLDPKTPIFHLNLAKALLRESKDDAAKGQLQECLNCAPDEPMRVEAQKLMANPERGRLEVAPDFQLTTMQGQQLSLQGLAGRVVVMDFWATWCEPCRDSVPELKDLTRKYPTGKLVLISVSADKDDKAWREFVEKKEDGLGSVSRL
jgi:thioredoxin-like negative regulator of GroEL